MTYIFVLEKMKSYSLSSPELKAIVNFADHLCPASICLSLRLSVNFNIFFLLFLQNHLAYCYRTFQKVCFA